MKDYTMPELDVNTFDYWRELYYNSNSLHSKISEELEETKKKLAEVEQSLKSATTAADFRTRQIKEFEETRKVSDFVAAVNRNVLWGEFDFFDCGTNDDDQLVFVIRNATLDDDDTIIPLEQEFTVTGEITLPFTVTVDAANAEEAESKTQNAFDFSSFDSTAFYSDEITEGHFDDWGINIHFADTSADY